MHPEHYRLLLLTLALLVLLMTSCSSESEPPPADPPPAEKLPLAVKGYELYSRRVGRDWYFILLGATNRAKPYREIVYGDLAPHGEGVRLTLRGIHDLQAALDQLPRQTTVAWLGPRTLRRRGVRPRDLALPPRRVAGAVEAYGDELGVQIRIAR